MTAFHWHVLWAYLGFTLTATLLALIRRWTKPGLGGESVWRKYPSYILINLCFLAASWLSRNWHLLTVLLVLLGGLASWEIARILLRHSLQIILFVIIASTLILLADFLNMATWFNTWLAIFLFAMALVTLTGKPSEYSQRALAVGGCVIYLPVCLAAYVWIQQSDPSGYQAVFLYLVIATNDAMAQITGELLGTKPLAVQISPTKTVEGAFGGILFAVGMGAALSSTVGWSYGVGALMGLTIGLAGLSGDMIASVWKRALGLKNFSELLGAQGGVLDRFDGLIFAAPVFCLLISG